MEMNSIIFDSLDSLSLKVNFFISKLEFSFYYVLKVTQIDSSTGFNLSFTLSTSSRVGARIIVS